MLADVPSIPDAVEAEEARGVVRRSHGLRTLGLVLGSLMVGTVLYGLDAPEWMWGLLALHALVWPHAAWSFLRRHNDPARLDRAFFLGDAAMGGLWVALMQFNLLPTVVLVSMFATTLIAVDGSRMLARGLAIMALVCAAVAAASGFAFQPESSVPEQLASLPLLLMFPMVLGGVAYGLARRMRAQNDELFRVGSVDSLSGLLNRMHWEDAVNAGMARGCRDAAVMLLIDIDHFKPINDRYGHTVGDEVIEVVGSVIRNSLRKDDVAGRYGGDEFAVVLCEASMESAQAVAERIRSDVACALLAWTPSLHCTLSIGLARCPGVARAVSDWVRAADLALYRAKLGGRDRAVLGDR